MGNFIQNLIISKVPRGKQSPNGWLSFNAVCCHNNKQARPDDKYRGGLKLDSDGSFLYNCFNCKFTASWRPGQLLNSKTRNLFKWFGVTAQEISKANFEALKIKENADYTSIESEKVEFNYDRVNLPEGARKLEHWANCDPVDERFLAVLEYLGDRHKDYIKWFDDFYWSPEMIDRVIIPFNYQGTIYGWTARTILSNKRPKYENSKGTKFIFGADNLFCKYRKYVILCEGVFDSIVIDGVAVLGSVLTEEQLKWINSTDKEIIVVADKDKDGQALIDIALENNWSVSFPDFGKGIKDISEAVKVFGRIMTTRLVISSKENNPLKINILRKGWN